MTSAMMVSKCILKKLPEPTSNLKLQKLLYYVQGWRLGLDNKCAFQEEIQAWVHGPVVPVIFQEFRRFRWNPIPKPLDSVVMPEEEIVHIENTLRVYGGFTATELERLSHLETPWIAARNGAATGMPSRNPITIEAMREYFAARLSYA